MNLSDIKNFQSISTDARTLQPGDLFIALIGNNFDGHDFVKEAEQKGAIAAVVSRDVNCNLTLIKTDNTFYALGNLAALRRQQVTIPLIAITGSCGKTTTKTMLASILNICGQTLVTQENLNNNIGVPLTLLHLTPEHDFAVIEMGANQVNEIAYSTKLARPNVAMITNAAPVHLQGFNDLDGVAKVKGDILLGLTGDGIAVLNADDKYFSFWRNLLKKQQSCVNFAIHNKADITATNVTTNIRNSCFVLHTPLGEQSIQLPVVGEHNVMNALAAAAAAYAVGTPLSAIKIGLETMQPVAGRMLYKLGCNRSLIIDDSYNANPRSMDAALCVLAQNPGEKIFVVGDMAELGNLTEQYHHELGIKARTFGVQRIFAIGRYTPVTVKAFNGKAYHFSDRGKLIAAINDILEPNVTVLVKGSKINRMWEIVNALLESNENK
jgi:UDP-N-acetylmuramoyl-tripeptide--D-alanyl-D-alanine ligase